MRNLLTIASLCFVLALGVGVCGAFAADCGACGGTGIEPGTEDGAAAGDDTTEDTCDDCGAPWGSDAGIHYVNCATCGALVQCTDAEDHCTCANCGEPFGGAGTHYINCGICGFLIPCTTTEHWVNCDDCGEMVECTYADVHCGDGSDSGDDPSDDGICDLCLQTWTGSGMHYVACGACGALNPCNVECASCTCQFCGEPWTGGTIHYVACTDCGAMVNCFDAEDHCGDGMEEPSDDCPFGCGTPGCDGTACPDDTCNGECGGAPDCLDCNPSTN